LLGVDVLAEARAESPGLARIRPVMRNEKSSTPPRKSRAPKAKSSAADPRPSTARPATEQELAAIVRAQEGQLSAEGFWKAAGRLTKLR
jgi:hypothetical protein